MSALNATGPMAAGNELDEVAELDEADGMGGPEEPDAEDEEAGSVWAKEDRPAPIIPYQHAIPPALETEGDTLQVQVNLYEETVTIQVHGEDGGEPEHLTTRRQRARVDDYTAYPVVRTKVVSAEEIAYRFAGNIDLRTGVLQEDTLWVVKNGGGKQTAIWRPPQVWEVKQIAAFGAEPVVYRLPMPGLVFLCGEDGRDPHVFAARRRPEREDEELYRCPAFNIFDNGRICQGSGQAWPRRESHVPEVFFHTYFTRDGHTRNRSQRHPERLDELWREIDGRQAYPLDDLVRQFTVADAMLLRTR